MTAFAKEIADPDDHVLLIGQLVDRAGEEMHQHTYAAAAATLAEVAEAWRLLDNHLCHGGTMPDRWYA